ncbi:zinc ribbon domain-containing protein [Adlercreutzia caecimuris]|uniref:zinc ribbon domain-containing protein n=1 Tax=Adlercreutzia caecimuris TaxID=671266 RepID=UPI00258965B4|nr:zinc ribbon domain-containing protein [Adlercreutzia caecimuris]
MPFKETLVETREQRGMTQQELASKLYVTRQAISRWENGETEPSVDMRKLIATVLDIPAIRLFDIDTTQLCQCCGTPFTVPNMPRGTEADGAENPDYCQWCYDSGQFVYQSEDELIEKTTPFLMEATGMSQDEAVSFMGVIVPHLKHWQR